MIFNLEAIRYTLYTGEPILTGIMRLRPHSRFWAVLYSILGIAQLATPGLALGCANVIFAAAMFRLAGSDSGDGFTLWWISLVLLTFTVVLLLSGRSIEKLLERLSWGMIVLIFSFLAAVNVLFVPAETWANTLKGFVTPTALPENVDVMMLALFAATAGSGGIGNLAISNWVRDKGFGMGRYMGGFGGLFASDHMELESTGTIFPINAENLRRWRDWWKYVLIDQSLLWALGCFVGMFLNVNLAASLIPAGTELAGHEMGAFQAQYMAEKLWSGLWAMCLLNGFWILFSTLLGNTDCLTRTVADMVWAGWPKVRHWRSSVLYASLLFLLFLWGVVALTVGDNALSLFKILGAFASPVLSISAVQILIVNNRFLPKELRPSWWRQCLLAGCAIFYGAIAVATVVDTLG